MIQSWLSRWKHFDSEPWHPDFKKAAFLMASQNKKIPLLTISLVAFVIIGIGTAGFMEWKMRGVLGVKYRLESEINRLEVNNQLYLRESLAFQGLMDQANVVSAFITPTEQWLDWVVAILKSPSTSMRLNQVSYKLIVPKKLEKKAAKKNEKSPDLVPFLEINLQGRLRGETENALRSLEDYKNQLQALPLLTPHIQAIEVGRVLRDDKTEEVDFEMLLRLTLLKP
jgi:hypothetical protein